MYVTLHAQPLHLVKTKLLFTTTSAVNITAAADAIMDGDHTGLKARGLRTHQVKIKLFAVTTEDETMVAIDTIMDGYYVVMKTRGHLGVMRCNKFKNKRL